MQGSFSIRAKLIAIVMTTTLVALCLAGLALALFEARSHRNNLSAELGTTAGIAAQNLSATLIFEQPDNARNALAGLHPHPDIVAACLYDSDGDLFADYLRAGRNERCQERLDRTAVGFSGGLFALDHPVVVTGRPPGTLRLVASLAQLEQRLRMFAIVLLLVLTGSALVALVLSSGLQRLVSRPILSLAQTAAKISQNYDYTLRAPQRTHDEVGVAVGAFNQMLERIEAAVSERKRAQEELVALNTTLEERVAARTAENVLLLEKEKEARAAAEAAQRRSALLARASGLLAEAPTLDEGLDKLASLLVPALGQWCTIYLLQDGELRRLACVHADPALQDELEKREERYAPHWEADSPHPVARVVQSGEPLLLGPRGNGAATEAGPSERAVDEAHAELLARTGAIGLAVPLVLRGRALGAIALGLRAPARPYDEADVELLVEVARRTALALDNVRKNELLSVASHELNTPLAGLKLTLDSLTDIEGPEIPERIRKQAGLALRLANRLSGLIRDLLDVTRIERGKLALQLEPVDLPALVRDVVARYQPELARAGCRVEIEVATPDLPDIRMDPSRIDQVILNLLSNAAKFGAGKPIEVKVAGEDGRARVSVTDHGIGITAAEQARIFDRFERGREATRFAGLGLGLYICRRIVETHQGAIRVVSQPGAGSTFTIELPVERAANGQQLPSPRRANA